MHNAPSTRISLRFKTVLIVITGARYRSASGIPLASDRSATAISAIATRPAGRMKERLFQIDDTSNGFLLGANAFPTLQRISLGAPTTLPHYFRLAIAADGPAP